MWKLIEEIKEKQKLEPLSIKEILDRMKKQSTPMNVTLQDIQKEVNETKKEVKELRQIIEILEIEREVKNETRNEDEKDFENELSGFIKSITKSWYHKSHYTVLRWTVLKMISSIRF